MANIRHFFEYTFMYFLYLFKFRMIVGVSRAVALLSNATLIKLLKSREFSHRGNTAWPTVLDIDDAPSSSITRQRKGVAGETNQRQKQSSDICYLDFAMNGNGQVTGVIIKN